MGNSIVCQIANEQPLQNEDNGRTMSYAFNTMGRHFMQRHDLLFVFLNFYIKSATVGVAQNMNVNKVIKVGKIILIRVLQIVKYR